MKIIADSGSTKTSWCMWNNAQPPVYIETTGINPVVQSADIIDETLRNELLPQLKVYGRIQPEEVTDVFFYGAGCLPEMCPALSRSLAGIFTRAVIEVKSDLLGAARALCGTQSGIACILGTGSNSCLYEQGTIVAHTPALGYILGDEGSGASLGRQLTADLLKGILPAELKMAFLERFGLPPADIIERVYRQPAPNRFLASLTPFLSEHRTHPDIHTLLISQFRSFFRRNIVPYNRPELPVHFVGSIASVFGNELREAARMEGFIVGTVLQSPVQRMQLFHAVS